MRNVMRWLAACAALAGLCTVQAQEYPSRPVRVLVPYTRVKSEKK